MKTNYDLTPYFNRCSISWYQDNCKVFMDEYEVEECDYLPLFDNTVLMSRFMRKD
jgi:hypothetical protein